MAQATDRALTWDGTEEESGSGCEMHLGGKIMRTEESGCGRGPGKLGHGALLRAHLIFHIHWHTHATQEEN